MSDDRPLPKSVPPPPRRSRVSRASATSGASRPPTPPSKRKQDRDPDGVKSTQVMPQVKIPPAPPSPPKKAGSRKGKAAGKDSGGTKAASADGELPKTAKRKGKTKKPSGKVAKTIRMTSSEAGVPVVPVAPAAPVELELTNDATATHYDVAAAARLAESARNAPAEGRDVYAENTITLCREALEEPPPARRAARLYYEMARLLESPLGRFEEAAASYTDALKGAPEHIPTLRGARRMMLQADKYADALPLIDREVALTAEPPRKAWLLYEKGCILEDRMGRKPEAQKAFQAALELDPNNTSVLKTVTRLASQAKAWDSLDSAYQATANAVSSDPMHRAAVIAERARLAASRKKDRKLAIELYETALGLNPHSPGVAHSLKALLYSEARWGDLIDVLNREADFAAQAEVRSMARYRVARLQSARLGNVDEAIEALERASEDAPGDTMILEELCAQYQGGRRWQPLVDALIRLCSLTSEPNSAGGIWHRVGQLYQDRLASEDEAIAAFRRALDTDPIYLPALQALGELYTKQEQWSALVTMYMGEAGAAKSADRRAAAHARVGELFERQLKSPEQAIDHHRKALALQAGCSTSFQALARLYSVGGKWRELIELYERQIEESPTPDAKITYLFKVGRLQEDALNLPAQAMLSYAKILEIDAGHFGAIHAVQRAAERHE